MWIFQIIGKTCKTMIFLLTYFFFRKSFIFCAVSIGYFVEEHTTFILVSCCWQVRTLRHCEYEFRTEPQINYTNFFVYLMNLKVVSFQNRGMFFLDCFSKISIIKTGSIFTVCHFKAQKTLNFNGYNTKFYD